MNTTAIVIQEGYDCPAFTIDFHCNLDLANPNSPSGKPSNYREELRQTIRNFADEFLGGEEYSVRFNDELTETYFISKEWEQGRDKPT